MPARLIVTRPAREAARWVDQLQQRGIPALALPLIDIVPEPDNAALLAARAQYGDYAAVWFVSAQAVRGHRACRCWMSASDRCRQAWHRN